MGFIKIADISGSTELVVFPSTWQKTAALWEPDKLVIVGGKVSRRDGDPKIIADTAEELITDQGSVIKQRWKKLRWQRREPLEIEVVETAKETPAIVDTEI
jgi:DNA polymerase III alpha subunit